MILEITLGIENLTKETWIKIWDLIEEGYLCGIDSPTGINWILTKED